MKKLIKLKYLYDLKNVNEEYFNGFSSDKEIIYSIPKELQELQKIVLNCNLCKLSKTRNNVVFGEGNPNSKIMFIGEAPGREEDLQGRPFVGRSGELLTKIIENILNIKREEIYISNIVKCRPPQNRDPEIGEVESCIPYLIKQIDIIKPNLIVTLGRIAFKYLLNSEISITQARGKLYNFKGIKVIPTYHPSYLLRNPIKKKEAFIDFKLIKEFL
jgi:uracil-DNA glycosylase family 4